MGIGFQPSVPGLSVCRFCGGHRGTVSVYLLAPLIFFSPASVIPLMLQFLLLVLEGRSGESWEPSEPQSSLFPSNKCGVTKHSTSKNHYARWQWVQSAAFNICLCSRLFTCKFVADASFGMRGTCPWEVFIQLCCLSHQIEVEVAV